MSKYSIGKKLIIVLSILVTVSCSYIIFNKADEQRVQMSLVVGNLKQLHFNSISVNDDFSAKVFTLYLKQLDYNKRFLTQEDSVLLSSYKTKLDDEINGSPIEFFQKANELYEKRLAFVATTYKTYLSSPFDFTTNETLQYDADKRPFPKDEADLKDQWRKLLKYQVLVAVQAKMEMQKNAKEKSDTVKLKSFEQLEIEARAKIQKDHDEMFKRLQRETKQERYAEYINSIVHVFDPHSDYFPPKEKENFDIQMSGKLEGIGATLQERDGYIKVMSIVPGSPSFKQGELKPEDYILKVGQGNEEPVDIVDMRLDNAVKLIRGKKGTMVKLTIKKPDGTIKVISIIRDVVVMEESYAKSVIVNDTKNNQRIGFINLPSFYADFNDRNGRTCSEDIRKELIKLKGEKVDGIILDLRNNGGGSLQDVVTMGGFFIDHGPIVQVRGREVTPYDTFGDEDPEIVYDGPLVILINQFSASASEILAAAMQDYKRAVIIGSTTSFGKGTVQRFYDLTPPTSDTQLGSIKITTQKFYRINGGSTQLKGVTPDIILPDLYTYMKIGEKEMEYAMPWDQIKAADYNVWKVKPFKISEIQSKSKSRTDKNETFQHILSNAEYMKQKQNTTNYTLNYKAYETELQNNKKAEENFKKEEKEITDWSFESLKVDAPAPSDSSAIARSKAYMKNLKKDAYLYEAVQVIKDIRK